VLGRLRQDVRDRLEHADLISAPGSGARQDERFAMSASDGTSGAQQRGDVRGRSFGRLLHAQGTVRICIVFVPPETPCSSPRVNMTRSPGSSAPFERRLSKRCPWMSEPLVSVTSNETG